MACAIRSCRKQILSNPNLAFFPLPKQHHLRDEWLEILGREPASFIGSIKVCERHFKPKDFCDSGKKGKQLKTHAVPVLNLGKGSSDPVDSEDEFMDYNSDDEIVELPVQNSKIKNEKSEEKNNLKEPVKEEPESEEVEGGRRPSRRAAREAAKKIYNSVRNFMPRTADDESFSNTSSTNSPPPQFTPRQRRRSTVKIVPAVDVDLVMECHEEILSPVQAEALLKAQLEYNMVMKTLRQLKAQNVRIICSKEPYIPPVQSTPTKNGVSSAIAVNANTTVSSQKVSVVPMTLSTNAGTAANPLTVV